MPSMTRIFLTMAGINGLALLVSFALGVPYLLDRLSGLEAPAPYAPLGTVSAHFVVGLFTVLFTLLVHCLIFTYFLGTGRWVKEVARAYGLRDQDLPRQTREFKRRAFPPALFSMLLAIATAAAGAGAQLMVWPWWVHFVLGVLLLAVNLWAYRIEYAVVAANSRVIEQVMAEVGRIQESGVRGQESGTKGRQETA
jgi:hypothetical protein